MDRPMLARVVIGVGLFLLIIALFADPLGLGRSPGFGWRQTLGAVVGVLVVVVGLSVTSAECVSVDRMMEILTRG
jgi:hypothetical protein